MWFEVFYINWWVSGVRPARLVDLEVIYFEIHELKSEFIDLSYAYSLVHSALILE